ncbi:MAG: hypothetical protein HZA58_00650 [Acidimicrobiia bacterium]|nr:hypothetical protein [Acidimicrobiia bacterium]
MSALAGGLLLAAVLVAIVAAFLWQGGRRFRDGGAVIYALDDASRFVHGRLDPATRDRVTPGQVRRVLEWQIEYQQVVAPRAGLRPVIGGGDAMEHILERAGERGDTLDPVDVAEIMAADVEYLMSIHAVGAPAEGGVG